MSESSENNSVKTEGKKNPFAAVAKAFANKKTRKLIIGVAAAVVAVCLIVCLGAAIGSRTGENGAVRRIMTVYQNGNAAALVKLAEGCSANGDGLVAAMATEDDYRYKIEGDQAYFKDKLSGKYQVSYKITGKKELTDSEVNDLLGACFDDGNSLKPYYGSVMKANVKITAKAGREKASIDKEICLIKIQGKWTLYYLTNS